MDMFAEGKRLHHEEGHGDGRRKRGRPKGRWPFCTKDNIDSLGAVAKDIRDRTSWRRRVHTMEAVSEMRQMHVSRMVRHAALREYYSMGGLPDSNSIRVNNQCGSQT